MQMPKPLHRGTQAALVALVLAPVAIGQEPGVKVTSKQTQTNIGESKKSNPDGLVRELDADSLALSKLPAAPLFRPDPLAPIFEPLNRLVDRAQRSERLKVGATYTFLEEYATTVPKEASRHDQVSGRLDLTAVWKTYERNSSAGSISLLVRSGTNIGMSRQFNLSDKLGSGLYLNALQGGGPQEPITVNVLYWREDFLQKRVSLYVGKIHPNQYVSLSMFDNNERTQFLNGENDGNVAFAYDGTYAGGAALEVQATPHLYVHTLAVDTEGSQQSNLKTPVNRKYMESGEVGWFSGSPGERYRDYRIYMWRDDTRSQGSGYGGGFGFEHEFDSGWAPFGKFGIATDHGTSIRQTNTLGVAQVHPFARRGDMFGVSFSYTEPNHTGKHHENVFESFYRIRLTQSVSLGPDLAVSVHPTYAIKTYTTALVGTRLEITF
jgi:porin